MDPTGLYKCTRSSEKCDQFNSDQNYAIGFAEETLKQVQGIKDTIESGGKLTKGQKRIQNKIEDGLGEGAGSDVDKLGALIGHIEGAIEILKSDIGVGFKPQPKNNKRAHAGAVIAGKKKWLEIYPAHAKSGFGRRRRAATLFHEALHHGPGLDDVRTTSGISPYNYPAFARKYPNRTLDNAASVTAAVFGTN